MNAFDGEHPFLHHLVEQRDDAVDVLGGVDDLDHDRQVLGQPQDARRVQAGIGAETLDAAQDGRAGEALLANALDEPEEVAVRTIRRRVFAGYAGWGAGQLEDELGREDWIVEPSRPDDAFTEAPEELWADVLRRKGGIYELVARIPEDPSVN